MSMKKKIIGFANDISGVAAVEFALLLPVLLAFVFGIINFGALLYNQAVITNAAREGARWGAINTTSAINCSGSTAGTLDPCQIANNYTRANLISFGATPISTTSASGTGTAGTTVTVSVTYQFTEIGWIVGNKINNLSATSVMYHE